MSQDDRNAVIGTDHEAEAVKAAAEAMAAAGTADLETLARVALEAARPLICAEIETQLEHAKTALAGDNEGIRLWMLDCAALVERWRKRANEASAPASDGAGLIAAERRRQIEAEGWTPEHDDHHTNGEMARAAACYALAASAPYWAGRFAATDDLLGAWPPGWDYKRTDPARMLTKAGALIAAEIDRIGRRDRDGDTQPDPYIDAMAAEHAQEYEPGSDDRHT